MVVSGVPQPNGDQHAQEIALMSLDLVHAAANFIIPHFPSEPLKIRVGIHSGWNINNYLLSYHKFMSG